MGPDAMSLESDMCIHISPPSWTCLLLPRITPLGHHRALGWAPYVTLAFFLSAGNVRVSMLLSQFVPPTPSPAVSTTPCSPWMFISPLLKPPHEYACSLSLKPPQFCYQCSPYLLQVINPSFSGKKKKNLTLKCFSDEPKRGTKVMVSWFPYDIDNICRRDFELCLGKSVREGRVAYVA